MIHFLKSSLTFSAGLLLLLAAPCPAAAEKVVLYYFHSTFRCTECLQIEQWTGEILRESFPQEMTRGELLWRPVNADLPESTPLVLKFRLSANELVMARQETEEIVAWEKIPETWSLAHDPERLRETVVTRVAQALAAGRAKQGEIK